MVKKITRLGQLLRRQLWQTAISNWSYIAVEGMIDEMIEDKITQDLQCFQSSLANSPHNDILWTCLVFLAASRQVWSIYWIIPPGLTVHILSAIIQRKSMTVANECMSATFLTCLLSYLPCNLSLWHERRHPAPAPGITS